MCFIHARQDARTDHNFNLAFEAGYALALNKPIVWTQKNDGKEFRLPFDIQSQNILLWHPDAALYGLRIGYNAVYTIGGVLRRTPSE
jgi:hypothetical protein